MLVRIKSEYLTRHQTETFGEHRGEIAIVTRVGCGFFECQVLGTDVNLDLGVRDIDAIEWLEYKSYNEFMETFQDNTFLVKMFTMTGLVDVPEMIGGVTHVDYYVPTIDWDACMEERVNVWNGGELESDFSEEINDAIEDAMREAKSDDIFIWDRYPDEVGEIEFQSDCKFDTYEDACKDYWVNELFYQIEGKIKWEPDMEIPMRLQYKECVPGAWEYGNGNTDGVEDLLTFLGTSFQDISVPENDLTGVFKPEKLYKEFENFCGSSGSFSLLVSVSAYDHEKKVFRVKKGTRYGFHNSWVGTSSPFDAETQKDFIVTLGSWELCTDVREAGGYSTIEVFGEDLGHEDLVPLSEDEIKNLENANNSPV